MKNLVYALCAPDGRPRYIGKSTCGLKRPRQHGNSAMMRQHEHLPVTMWVRSLRARGLDYSIEVVEETKREKLNEAEIFWIASFRSWGFKLLNCTDGGEGMLGFHRSPESRERVARALRGRTISSEQRAKISASVRATMATPESRAKLLARPPLSAEVRERINAANRGRALSPEHRKKLSDTTRGRPLSPEHVANMRAARRRR